MKQIKDVDNDEAIRSIDMPEMETESAIAVVDEIRSIIDSLAVEVPEDGKRCPHCGETTGHQHDHVILEHDGEQFSIVGGAGTENPKEEQA